MQRYHLNMDPNDVDNDLINKIGSNYLKKFGESPSLCTFLLHFNHGIARELRAYHANVPAKQKWEFIVEKYRRLPNNNGDLAKSLRRFFEQAFHYTIPLKISESDFKNNTVVERSTSKDDVADIMDNYIQIYFAEKSLQQTRDARR